MTEVTDQEHFPFLDFIGKDLLPCRVEIKNSVFSIGRGNDNDLRIEDSRISRKHVEIVRVEGNRHVLRDRKSKGGSFVNGRRVEEHELQSGDEIILGGFNAIKLTFGYFTNQSTPDSYDTVLVPLDHQEERSQQSGKKLSIWLDNVTIITDEQTRFLNTDLIHKPDYVNETTLHRLTSLYEITHKLLPMQNINELAEVWLDALFKFLPIERGAILLYNPKTSQLEITSSRDKVRTKNRSLRLSTTIIEKTFEKNVAILASDAVTDERFSEYQSVSLENIRSVLSAPISSKLRVWGVCYLDSRTKTALFKSEDLEFLMATAREAGLVIENLRLIEELRATQEQLIKSERLATIGKLTSSISHELRNRLTLLAGMEMIEMKYSNDPEVKQFAEMVRMGQRRALDLVEEIRAFAHNRSDEFQRVCKPIVPTIERAISIMRLDPALTRRTLEFNFDCSPEFFFNEGKIEQVIINLIRNAIEATVDDEGKISVTLTTKDNEAIIRIIDNGAGIPAEIMDQIWEPFFTTKGEEGTGLGLEICRRIIEAHGGRIHSESEIDHGTCFTIRLPL
jgi:signal transduction histidine kinase/pSer/pThr/pTyr-binding forkhead associated (FHA) protein